MSFRVRQVWGRSWGGGVMVMRRFESAEEAEAKDSRRHER